MFYHPSIDFICYNWNTMLCSNYIGHGHKQYSLSLKQQPYDLAKSVICALLCRLSHMDLMDSSLEELWFYCQTMSPVDPSQRPSFVLAKENPQSVGCQFLTITTVYRIRLINRGYKKHQNTHFLSREATLLVRYL